MKFAVVIPSRNARNLSVCLSALEGLEPDATVIVVDDGLDPKPVNCLLRAGVKPFVFARNANVGLNAAFFEAKAEVAILLNDDAVLQTPGGFSALAQVAHTGWSYPITKRGEYGLVSAAIMGGVGNPRQQIETLDPARVQVRLEPRMLCFVCVAIPFETWEMLGPLDERFIEYGFDDDDYSKRALNADLKLAIFDGCVVEHGSLPSTFRGPGGAGGNLAGNRKRFVDKWCQSH